MAHRRGHRASIKSNQPSQMVGPVYYANWGGGNESCLHYSAQGSPCEMAGGGNTGPMSLEECCAYRYGDGNYSVQGNGCSAPQWAEGVAPGYDCYLGGGVGSTGMRERSTMARGGRTRPVRRQRGGNGNGLPKPWGR